MTPFVSERSLDTLQFDNQFTGQLPADPSGVNARRQVHQACYSRVRPTPSSAPRLLAWSPEAAALLDLNFDPFQDSAAAEVFSGNRLLPGMDPFAMCYGGHQFGNWAGQLGDGRAINLGETVNSRGQRWMLQLKGAGPTPYSRTADGLAVLRSSVREFLCSEAMYHLGVPTTRALSLVTSGDQVMRDMFYDGNPQWEPGAIVCRLAPSFTRFGNFQIFASRRDLDTLRTLVDYTIRTDFPHLGPPAQDVREAWFREICQTTADLMIHWMRVGFVHGVMNTDNMSVLGLTIDYGPYGWLENYDPGWTPNTTDAEGRRYRYSQQPQVALWNLAQLGGALAMIFPSPEPLQQALDEYTQRFNAGCHRMLLQKLGLEPADEAADQSLIQNLLETLQLAEVDMTIFYRRLADFPCADSGELGDPTAAAWLTELWNAAWYVPEQLTDAVRQPILQWLQQYQARVQRSGISDPERRLRMNAVNPKYVLRNYLAQLAIDRAEAGDASLIHRLQEVLRHPYDEQPEHEDLAGKRPDWARRRAGCSMLSCSS